MAHWILTDHGWSFSMNSWKIKKLASWERYRHDFDRKWDVK